MGENVSTEEPEGADTQPLTPEVAAVLVDNHRKFLGFLERRLGDRALAEDILQDAFVRSLGKAGTVRQPESLVAWFYSLLRNAIVDSRRRGGTAAKALAELATELETEASGTETRGVICGCVGRLAVTLKPDYAEALRRVELDGISVKDYAAEVGITSNNAGVRVFRAREALRRQVQRSCGTCATHGCVDCTCGKA
jgi:RNA polymerase sigma factor (sigma-70 family)